MSGSYLLAYTSPATEIRPARSGSSRYDTLFRAYEDILYNYDEYPAPGEVSHIYRASPDGRLTGEPRLTVRFNEDGSREESGPLALPPCAETTSSCPGCPGRPVPGLLHLGAAPPRGRTREIQSASPLREAPRVIPLVDAHPRSI